MLERFKTVLVTTDFSEHGDHAIAHAFRIAADNGCPVVLCHVIETVVTPSPLYAQYYPTDLITPEIRARAEQDATQALLDRVPKAKPLSDVAHSVKLAHGSPAREIVHLGETVGADLIVISTRGHTGLKHIVLGSVVERVIRHAHCAVLVVR
ncbi:MAG: universal stress protein [Deltaproteobacteria bacterium]|nr:universal stress protein [Deltaproteobacteria bacterium]MBI3391524.1 universal stress protein [Deltaproteobacteria bacterium]